MAVEVAASAGMLKADLISVGNRLALATLQTVTEQQLGTLRRCSCTEPRCGTPAVEWPGQNSNVPAHPFGAHHPEAVCRKKINARHGLLPATT